MWKAVFLILPILLLTSCQAHQAQQFESKGALKEWINQKSYSLESVNQTGWDCDDYAQWLQDEAYEEGYIISCQLIDGGKIADIDVSGYRGFHMGCLANIGNECYYIEPMYLVTAVKGTIGVAFVCNLD